MALAICWVLGVVAMGWATPGKVGTGENPVFYLAALGTQNNLQSRLCKACTLPLI